MKKHTTDENPLPECEQRRERARQEFREAHSDWMRNTMIDEPPEEYDKEDLSEITRNSAAQAAYRRKFECPEEFPEELYTAAEVLQIEARAFDDGARTAAADITRACIGKMLIPGEHLKKFLAVVADCTP